MTQRDTEGVRIIQENKRILAIAYCELKIPNGVRFLTPLHYPLQVGVHEYRRKRSVTLHRHPDLHYRVNTTQEFLYIEKGKAIITVTNRRWKTIATVVLKKGDFILFVDGGHQIEFSPSTRIVEIKQGPYPGDKKAKIFKNSPHVHPGK